MSFFPAGWHNHRARLDRMHVHHMAAGSAIMAPAIVQKHAKKLAVLHGCMIRKRNPWAEVLFLNAGAGESIQNERAGPLSFRHGRRRSYKQVFEFIADQLLPRGDKRFELVEFPKLRISRNEVFIEIALVFS